MRRRLTLTAAVAALALPAGAEAHVTLQPASAPAGGFARLDVRVPNERDDAGTTKVDVQMPPGIVTASYEPVPGWDVKVTKEKLDKPVKVEGFDATEQVSRITWSGGRIGPGEFQDFGLSLRVPDGKPGSKLTFKALQTYEGGEIVRWIGPEDGDEPAPVVTLVAAAEAGGHGAPGSAAAAATGASAPTPAEDDSDTLAIAALIVGALGLLAAIASLFLRRKGAA